MSKIKKSSPIHFEDVIMAKVKSNEIIMKPRWYFMLGSLSMMIGLVSLSIGVIFLTNLTFFLLRQHGPMGQWRLQLMLNSFPLWVPVLAGVGIVLGVFMLKKYDFSYKKNFSLIIFGLIVSIIFSAAIIDYLGINETWSHQGLMRRFYQQIEGKNMTLPRGQGQGWMKNK